MQILGSHLYKEFSEIIHEHNMIKNDMSKPSSLNCEIVRNRFLLNWVF